MQIFFMQLILIIFNKYVKLIHPCWKLLCTQYNLTNYKNWSVQTFCSTMPAHCSSRKDRLINTLENKRLSLFHPRPEIHRIIGCTHKPWFRIISKVHPHRTVDNMNKNMCNLHLSLLKCLPIQTALENNGISFVMILLLCEEWCQTML